MNPTLSRHATIRSQQRGISPHAIEALLDYGTEHHDHHGAVILLLDRAATKRITRSNHVRGPDLDTLRGLYAVLTGDGRVRTVGHRTRRVRRLGACRTCFRVCDGDDLGAVQGASPKAYEMYGEGEQRRNAPKSARPFGLLPKSASPSLQGSPIFSISASPCA